MKEVVWKVKSYKKYYKAYQSNKIVSVKAYDKELNGSFHWQENKKGTFFKSSRKQGFVLWDMYDKPFSKEELESGYFQGLKLIVEGKNVYYRPCLVISFANGKTINRSYKDFLRVLKEAKKINNLIKENGSIVITNS